MKESGMKYGVKVVGIIDFDHQISSLKDFIEQVKNKQNIEGKNILKVLHIIFIIINYICICLTNIIYRMCIKV
jgi:hypothetical protein